MKYHFNNTNFKFMKTFKAALILLIFLFAPHMKAQQSRASDQAELETKNNMSYYQRRGLEDAQHEQELEVKSKQRNIRSGKNKKNTKRIKEKMIEEHIVRIFKVKRGLCTTIM
jgi:hypothetical protein